MGFWFVAKLYIPFHSGRNGRKISYRFEVTPHSTLYQISGCFGAFQPISGEMDISADSRRDGHFGRYTFWGNFFFFLFLSFNLGTPNSKSSFLSPLDFSDLSASSSCQLTLTPAVNRPLQPLVSSP